MDPGGSSPDGVGPSGGVVVGAEAVDEDAFVGLAGEGDDVVAEIVAVEGDDFGLKRFKSLGESSGGDSFGHGKFGMAGGGEFGEERETAIDDGVGEHVVAAEGVDKGGSGDLFGVDVNAAAAAEEGEGLVEGGKRGAELGEGEVGDGTAFDRGIVAKDELSVAGGADVEFDVVAAEGDGGFDGGEGVFGMMVVGGAVGDDGDARGGGGEGGEEGAAGEHRGSLPCHFVVTVA